MGAGVLLSVSKIDGGGRKDRRAAWRQHKGKKRSGPSERKEKGKKKKNTLKTICTRIPSVSKSSGERVPADRKTY